VRAHRSFTVRTQLPESLTRLSDLALNLRWSWDDRCRRLFRWVDPDQWEVVRHDPVRLLGTVPASRLHELANDPSFMAFLDEIHDDLARYMDSPGWMQLRGPSPLRNIAYFSPEFGISEALPQYSGGLGVLAGDHLKAASGLKIPLTGIGLFYKQGYFSQGFRTDGLQQENYPILDPHLMALKPAISPRTGQQARVEVDLAGQTMAARVWLAQVGTISLYLLDADVEENAPEVRAVTDRLYGGGEEQRIRQEILLGIGGVRALRELQIPTQVFHTNEGHAGFLGFERIREFVRDHGLSFDQAIEAARAGTLFTTHTPVPAGIDKFPRHMIEQFFSAWCSDVGITVDRLMEIGHEADDAPDAPFNMAIMGLRLAGQANGVSKLHGDVSRKMFSDLWPGVPVDEVPIGAVTNGVHARTWISQQLSDLYDRYVLPDFPEAGPDRWAKIHDCPDEDLWRVRSEMRARLVSFVRTRTKASGEARGMRGADLAWCDRALDPNILTIGFSRRFATYKRSTLLLSDVDRLKRLLLDPDRPMQMVFAGKAHPADAPGKELIKRIQQFAADPEVRHRFSFVENYDIGVARMIYQGADVWLNNPRRPMEACGTSGEKSVLCGGLQLSILDGWWDEMYRAPNGDRPGNGWAIPSSEATTDDGARDWAEAQALFELLEREVVPLFYDRPDGSMPRRWIYKVKTSLETLGADVQASRMVRDYVTDFYEPAARRNDLVLGKGVTAEPKGAVALQQWKAGVRSAWSGVKIEQLDMNGGAEVLDVGTVKKVHARVQLGSLTDTDIDVQVVHGPVGINDEIAPATVASMARNADGTYTASIDCTQAGRYGVTLRVVPRHPALGSWTEVGVQTLI
jgi:glycogen phosphorylase